MGKSCIRDILQDALSVPGDQDFAVSGLSEGRSRHGKEEKSDQEQEQQILIVAPLTQQLLPEAPKQHRQKDFVDPYPPACMIPASGNHGDEEQDPAGEEKGEERGDSSFPEGQVEPRAQSSPAHADDFSPVLKSSERKCVAVLNAVP